MTKYLFLFLLCPLLLTGCGSTPVPHLNFAVSTLNTGDTKAEVTAALGEPTVKREVEGREQWVYVVSHKSFWKRVWVVNLFAGSVSYDVVMLTFDNDLLSASSFRYVDEEEFAKLQLYPAAHEGADEF